MPYRNVSMRLLLDPEVYAATGQGVVPGDRDRRRMYLYLPLDGYDQRATGVGWRQGHERVM